MKFQVKSSSVRSGTLFFEKTAIETPAVLSFTRTGFLPFLTKSVRKTREDDMLLVALEHMVDNNGKPPASTLSDFLGPGIFMLDSRSLDSITTKNRALFKTKVSVNLPSDQRGFLTVESYVNAIEMLKPHAVLALSDYFAESNELSTYSSRTYNTSENEPGKKQKTTSKQHLPLQQARRNYNFLLEMVTEMEDRGMKVPLIAGLFGQDDISAREENAKHVAKVKCAGYYIPLRNPRPELIIASVAHLPEEKPRFLIGCATFNEMVESIAAGVDVVDDSLAFSATNNKHALIASFSRNLTSLVDLNDDALFDDFSPIQEGCACWVCKKEYSKSYVHHLVKKKEILADILLMSHNLHTVHSFVAEIRLAIESGSFEELFREFKG